MMLIASAISHCVSMQTLLKEHSTAGAALNYLFNCFNFGLPPYQARVATDSAGHSCTSYTAAQQATSVSLDILEIDWYNRQTQTQSHGVVEKDVQHAGLLKVTHALHEDSSIRAQSAVLHSPDVYKQSS